MLGAAGGLSAVVAFSSGCIGSNGLAIQQKGLLGPGVMVVSSCVSQKNSQACPSGGRSGIFPTPTPGTGVQALVGFRTTTAYVFPDTVADPASPVFFDWFGGNWKRSPTYEAALTELYPPPPGQRWTGYISEPREAFTPGATYVDFVEFLRPPAADGTPSPSGVDAVLVQGVRSVTADHPADRPVECSIASVTVCDEQFTTYSFAKRLHDLSILRPPAVTAARGTTAVIPITAKFAGEADPKYNFALTATTTLPGTSATPNVPTLAPPADSTTSVSVSVPVPADAVPGTYGVTVTATLSTGETRSATGTLVVPAPPGTPAGPQGGTPSGGVPTVRFGVARGFTAAAARTRGLPVRLITDTATRATITLSQARRVRIGRRVVVRSVRVARRTVTVLAGTTTVRVKSRNLRPGTVTVLVSGTRFSVRGRTVLR
ncbi:MAG: hypothetical protein U0237_14780 [Thermoleophilia bacterium]